MLKNYLTTATLYVSILRCQTVIIMLRNTFPIAAQNSKLYLVQVYVADGKQSLFAQEKPVTLLENGSFTRQDYVSCKVLFDSLYRMISLYVSSLNDVDVMPTCKGVYMSGDRGIMSVDSVETRVITPSFLPFRNCHENGFQVSEVHHIIYIYFLGCPRSTYSLQILIKLSENKLLQPIVDSSKMEARIIKAKACTTQAFFSGKEYCKQDKPGQHDSLSGAYFIFDPDRWILHNVGLLYKGKVVKFICMVAEMGSDTIKFFLACLPSQMFLIARADCGLSYTAVQLWEEYYHSSLSQSVVGYSREPSDLANLVAYISCLQRGTQGLMNEWTPNLIDDISQTHFPQAQLCSTFLDTHQMELIDAGVTIIFYLNEALYFDVFEWLRMARVLDNDRLIDGRILDAATCSEGLVVNRYGVLRFDNVCVENTWLPYTFCDHFESTIVYSSSGRMTLGHWYSFNHTLNWKNALQNSVSEFLVDGLRSGIHISSSSGFSVQYQCYMVIFNLGGLMFTENKDLVDYCANLYEYKPTRMQAKDLPVSLLYGSACVVPFIDIIERNIYNMVFIRDADSNSGTSKVRQRPLAGILAGTTSLDQNLQLIRAHDETSLILGSHVPTLFHWVAKASVSSAKLVDFSLRDQYMIVGIYVIATTRIANVSASDRKASGFHGDKLFAVTPTTLQEHISANLCIYTIGFFWLAMNILLSLRHASHTVSNKLLVHLGHHIAAVGCGLYLWELSYSGKFGMLHLKMHLYLLLALSLATLTLVLFLWLIAWATLSIFWCSSRGMCMVEDILYHHTVWEPYCREYLCIVSLDLQEFITEKKKNMSSCFGNLNWYNSITCQLFVHSE